MMDVAHYHMEHDMVLDGNLMEARDKFRAFLYGKMYQEPYTWGGANTRGSGERSAQDGDEFSKDDAALMARNVSMASKPYVPPTEIQDNEHKPFGDLLDAPMGY